MEEDVYFYLIGVGSADDWEAGRGSLYYIEDRNSEKYIPVFTTSEKVKQYVTTNFADPMAYVTMLESLGAAHAEPLVESRYIFMPLDAEGVSLAAAATHAAYLVKDPRPGVQQEVLRLDE